MNEFIAVENLEAVMTRKVVIPTVLWWNRLEGRPRRTDFQRALQAEVRDALWMLSRQWQVGEFTGDDAASPIFAKVHVDTSTAQRFQPGDGAPRNFDAETPLEATVERRPIPLATREKYLSLDVRVLVGRHWLKLLGTRALDGLASEYVDHYGIDEPSPDTAADVPVTANAEAWQRVSALAGRAMDGVELYLHLQSNPAHRAHDGIAGAAGHETVLDELAGKLTAWFENTFHQPPEPNDAWQADQLEYQFALDTSDDDVLVAEEYFHGHLDWYNVDVDPTRSSLEEAPSPPPPGANAGHTLSFFPSAIQFEGMPNTRWWAFEDGRTNFGDVQPDTTDLAKLLLIEFGLVYANDWFLLPFQLPVGSFAKVAGVAVTNVFGERTWIHAAGAGPDDAWQRWAMFNLTTRGELGEPADTMLAVLPTVPKVAEGEPIEDVLLVRDEVSNMVWGIEKRVSLPDGSAAPGREVALGTAERHRQILAAAIDGGLVSPPVFEPAAAIRYELMSQVPENWIPFIPVHVDDNNQEIQLQRASMPRILPGNPDPPEKIKPRTPLLREGLDETPPRAYHLLEQEVTRAGVRVIKAYQRTRWHDGRVYTWLGVRKITGRGEGSSGLAFDRIVSALPGATSP